VCIWIKKYFSFFAKIAKKGSIPVRTGDRSAGNLVNMNTCPKRDKVDGKKEEEKNRRKERKRV
jgi:hypothetical protein